jgi:hypothetical protein
LSSNCYEVLYSASIIVVLCGWFIYAILVHVLHYTRNKLFWRLAGWIVYLPFSPCKDILLKLKDKKQTCLYSIASFFRDTRSTFLMRNYLLYIDIIGFLISLIPIFLKQLIVSYLSSFFSFTLVVVDYYYSISNP